MGLSFNYLSNKFLPEKKTSLKKWISSVIRKEKLLEGKIIFIFCTDEELLSMNIQFLEHNTLTDIITFDYGENKKISGEIYISIERVTENAKKFKVSFEQELHRVMVHGILHLCGYKDKKQQEKLLMRKKETEALRLLD